SLPPLPPASRDVVRPILRDVLVALEPAPAHIRDLRWNVLAWNSAESYLVDWHTYPPAERNIVWHHFMNPIFRRIMVNWEREARAVLSEFRMEIGQRAEDPWLASLVEYLHDVSAEFRRWWPLHEVRRERELPIEIRHPDVGRLLFQPISVAFTTERHLFMRVL